LIIVFKLLVIQLVGLLAVGSVWVSQTEPPSEHESAGKKTFEVSKIDESITKELLKAWKHAHNGVDNIEAAVLILENLDGSYRATRLPHTNEVDKVTFKWDPARIAVVHTHPTRLDPKPSEVDMRLAARFGVPILTMTCSGMYMYDPVTKRITLIQRNLDWLSASKWKRNAQ
jgi:proteasome lid subunit RPN8/RPN11